MKKLAYFKIAAISFSALLLVYIFHSAFAVPDLQSLVEEFTGNFTEDYFTSSSQAASASLAQENKCSELIPGHNLASANRANIIIVGFGYNSAASNGGEIVKQIADYVVDWQAERYGLFSVEPFKSNKDKFNVWYINESYPLSACSDVGSWDKYGGCEDVESVLSQCPQTNQYVFYLANALFRSTGGNPAQLSVIYRDDLRCEDIGKCQNLRDISILHNPCVTPNSYRYQRDFPQDVNNDGTINNLDLLFGINCPYLETQGCTGQDYSLMACDDELIKFDTHVDKIFVHEFGHQFGDLRDESVGALGDQPLDPSGNSNTNCLSFSSLDECRQKAPWKNLIGNGCGKDGVVDCTNPDGSHKPGSTAEVDCYFGCKFTGTYRSIDEGIMKKLDCKPYVFGLYNEKLIKEKLDAFTGNLSKPDLIVTDINIEKRPGDAANYIYVNVKNIGGNALPANQPVRITIKDKNNGKIYESGLTDNIVAGYSKEVSSAKPIPEKATRKYNLEATVDANNVYAESNETNNSLLKTITIVKDVPKPDLTVTDVTYTIKKVVIAKKNYQSITFNITYKNSGNIAITKPFYAAVKSGKTDDYPLNNGWVAKKLIGASVGKPIKIGQEYKVSVGAYSLSFGKKLKNDFSFYIDRALPFGGVNDNRISESNEENNLLIKNISIN